MYRKLDSKFAENLRKLRKYLGKFAETFRKFRVIFMKINKKIWRKILENFVKNLRKL